MRNCCRVVGGAVSALFFLGPQIAEYLSIGTWRGHCQGTQKKDEAVCHKELEQIRTCYEDERLLRM